jgi:hypothetical protein
MWHSPSWPPCLSLAKQLFGPGPNTDGTRGENHLFNATLNQMDDPWDKISS